MICILPAWAVVYDRSVLTAALCQGPNLTIHHPDDVLATMNEWCIEHHGTSGEAQRVSGSLMPLNSQGANADARAHRAHAEKRKIRWTCHGDRSHRASSGEHTNHDRCRRSGAALESIFFSAPQLTLSLSRAMANDVHPAGACFHTAAHAAAGMSHRWEYSPLRPRVPQGAELVA